MIILNIVVAIILILCLPAKYRQRREYIYKNDYINAHRMNISINWTLFWIVANVAAIIL